VAIGTLVLDPSVAQNVLGSIRTELESSRKKGVDPVLLCSPAVRPAVRQLIQHDFRDTAVLSFMEVPDSIQVDMLSMITVPKGAECEAILDG
jgi:flagellar biosynthesis protein FlhA